LCEKLKHSLAVSKCLAQEQVTLHKSKARQRERMGSDFAGLKRCGRSSDHPLVTKVGHFAYWSVLVVIFAWAVWLRFRLPLDPIAVPAYVMPALGKLTGAEFGDIHAGRTIIYPGFVYLLVRAFGDFRAITVTQHLLGLLAGGVFLLTWRRIRDFIPSARLPDSVYRCLGLFAVAIYMFSTEPLYFEMNIRPEGICGFLISINLYFVIQFAACCFLEARRTATVIFGIGVVFSSILLASVKPSFWLTAIVALLPVGIFFFRQGWFSQKIVLAGGAAASAALLLLPEHVLIPNNKVRECFWPAALFVIHANLIRDQMADDLERGAKVPYPREWLGRVQAALSAEMAKSSAASRRYYGHTTLGFDPDYLLFNRTSIRSQLRKEFGDNSSALCAFYCFYYWRIWQQRPLLVVKKIVRQMAIFYAPKCPAYRLGKSRSLSKEYSVSVTSLGSKFYSKTWTAYPPAADFIRRAESLARSAPVAEQSAYIRRPLGALAATYLPLLLIAVALSALVLSRETHRKRLGYLVALVLFVYLYNLANCLEVAIVHSLENPRYATVQMYFVILAQFLAILLILEILLGKSSGDWRKRSER
jgi:hypothetical protein